MSGYTALFDACVLYPARLRDLLMCLAETNLFRARWTDKIHDEWIESLVKRGQDRNKLQRTRGLMNNAVPDCLITGYEAIESSIVLPDPDDRHVLAAAIIGDVDVIVTANLKDFPDSTLRQYNIEAQHPDDFVVCQLDLSPGKVCAAVKNHRTSLKRNPESADEYLKKLAQLSLPLSAERLREFAGVI